MKKLFLLIVMSYLYACGAGNTGEQMFSDGFPVDRVITIDKDSKCLISDAVGSIDYVILEDIEESFLKRAHNIKIHNDKIYLRDIYEDKLIAFNMADGAFLFSIDSRGRGPKEYLNFNNYTVDDDYIYAVVYNGDMALYTYNANTGEYINGKVLPFNSDGIEVLNNGDLIFYATPPWAASKYNAEMPMPDEEWRYRLFVTDRDLNIKKRMFGYDENTYRNFWDDKMCIMPSGDKLIFHYGNHDYLIAVMDMDNLDNIFYINIDPGKNKIPEEYKNDVDAIDENGYTRLGNIIHCDGYIYMSVIKGGQGTPCLYSYKDDVMMVNPDNDNFGRGLFWPQYGYNNRMVSIVSSLNYKTFASLGQVELNKEEVDRIENGATMLVFYTMKE